MVQLVKKMRGLPSSLEIIDNLPSLRMSLLELTNSEVLVGIPEANNERESEDDQPEHIGNAAIGYIMEHGSPAQNIPARPFLTPGIERAKARILSYFQQAGNAALDSNRDKLEKALGAAGMAAATSARNVIREGIPPPLKPATVAARRRARQTASKRKSEQLYAESLRNGLTADVAQETAGIVPLYNTGQLLRSITYVIKKKEAR